MTIQEQMKKNFDKEIQKDINGFSYDVDLIEDLGSGFPTTGSSYRTRCQYYGKDKRKIFRVSTDDPLHLGLVIFIPALAGELEKVSPDGFSMIIDQPDAQPDCNKAFPERCNALITICKDIPTAVDEYGFQVDGGGGIKTLIKDLPVIVNHAQTIQSGSGVPGITVDDQITVMIQRNQYTQMIDHDCWFRLDHTQYRVFDAISDVHGTGGGILRLMCRCVSGSYSA